jgi:hypothetical protein
MPSIAHKRNITILMVAVTVAVVNFISMPAKFYAGDSYAIKSEAINLVRNGKFGFTKDEAYKIAGFLDVKDQYFKYNESTGKYHNRWGLFDLAISIIPELANIGRPEQHFKGGLIKADEASIFSHNIFNIILSVVLALFLYKTALLFTRINTLSIFLVFSTLYASFAWNYMRVQSYEIVQLTLFTVFFYYYVLFLRAVDGRHRFTSCRSFYSYNLCLAGLCLSKSFYFYLYPVLFIPLCAKLIHNTGESMFKGLMRHRVNLAWVVLGGVITMIVFLLFSYVSYGEIFFGYLKNHPHDGKIGFSYIFIPDRLHDYFLSENRSLFVHMPLLITGLVGFPWYLRRHRYEAWFLLGAFLFAVVYFSFCYTVGEWCYGPRFFLFMLPVMCLPSACLVEMFIRRRQYVALSALSGAMLIVSVISLRAQIDVNTRDFHLRYLLEGALQRNIGLPPEVKNYFEHANYAVIARDANILAAGGRTGYLAKAYGKYFPDNEKDELFRKLRVFVTSRFPENYFLKSYYSTPEPPAN